MGEIVLSKDKVRKFMKDKNIKTQTELAKKMGITKSQLSLMLSPKFNPIKSNVQLLCEILGVELEDIIKNKDMELYTSESNSHSIVEENYNPIQLSFVEDEFIDISQVAPKRKYNVLELFAGGGGMALGLEMAGFKTIGLVENEKNCCNTLRHNRKDWNVIEKDIKDVASFGIKKYIGDIEVDVVSGGYPCQAFSYAGKKLGLEDTRGTLFYYYAEILYELQPKVFVAENVKGLVNHDNGRTLKTMINVFEEVGYNVEYKLLKALDYGVAQKRERIVIIGIRKDLKNIEYKYPKPFEYKLNLRDALKDVPESAGASYPKTKKEVLDLVPPGGYWKDLPDEIAKEYMGKSYYSSGGRTGMARRISWDEPCLTLTCSPAQKQTERCHPDETRPFTIREYARIQSFPDSWNFMGAMGEQYKQIGNAVPVNMAKAIGLSVVNVLNEMENQNRNEFIADRKIG